MAAADIRRTAVAAVDGDGDETDSAGSPPRRRWATTAGGPTGRALLGGLLVATAAVGVVAATAGRGETATSPVVVATAALAPGTPLGPDVLDVVQMAVPDELRDATFADPVALVGTVSRGAVAPGELVQRGAVVAATAAQRAAAPTREVAFTVDADRALGGRLEAGDRIDLLATYGTGADAWTTTVLADAEVLWVDRADGGIGSGRSVTVAVGLDDGGATRAVAHAVDVATVTVVRTTTAPGSGGAAGDGFRPRPPAEVGDVAGSGADGAEATP